MKKFLLIGLLGVAFWYYNHGQLPSANKSITPVLDASGNAAVWIFTFNGCGSSCADAVMELRKRKVPFTEKVVSAEGSNFKLWEGYKTDDTFPLIIAGEERLTGFYVPDIASILGNVFGDKYLTQDEQRYFKSHFNSDGSPRVALYGTDWCRYCAALRKELHAHQVSFEDIDVEKTEDKDVMLQTMGIAGYPATWVGYTRVKNGANFSDVMALLK